MILNIIYHVCIVMKISFEGGLVILLFIVVILYANFGGSSYIPYTKDSLFSHMYPYEGFTDFPSAVKDAANTNGLESSIQDATKGTRNIFESSGLQAGIYGDYSPIDEVSKLKGSPDCVGNSMGYSNSLGGLCFTEDLKKKLTSRGGNQSGASAQIGQ